MTPGHAVDSSAIDHGAGAAFGHHGIEMAQEADRLEVLAPAIDVGHPFAGLRL